MSYDDVTDAEHVDQAIAVLDELRPGWEREIDLGTLDIACCDNCILGQLGVIVAKEMGKKVSTGYGFLLYEWQVDHMGGIIRYAFAGVSNEAWIAAIKRRHDLGVFSDS